MSKVEASKNAVIISRDIWEWAKSNPAFSELIEILEDLNDLKKAKKEKGKPMLLSDVIERYEKSHHTKLDV
jgi:hypothetical protein